MPLPHSLRPIVLPSARHLSSTPFRLLCSPVIHQHHHRRTTTTLRPSAKSQNYAFLAGFAIAAAMFVAALWPRPQRSHKIYALYKMVAEELIRPTLNEAFQDHLGCQNVQYEASRAFTSSTAPNGDVAKVADIQRGLVLDADAASGDMNGNIIGVCLTAMGREEKELLPLLRQILNNWDRQGLLRREGMAVCLISCKDVDGIWIYGKEGVEVGGTNLRVSGGEGRWLSQILYVKKNF